MYESKLICRSTLKSETSQPPTPTVSRVGRNEGTELLVGRSLLEQCGARAKQLEVQARELDGEAARTVFEQKSKSRASGSQARPWRKLCGATRKC